MQSGSGPDLFWTNGTATSTMADFAENGAIVDLSSDVDFSFISEDAMKLATIDGAVLYQGTHKTHAGDGVVRAGGGSPCGTAQKLSGWRIRRCVSPAA